MNGLASRSSEATIVLFQIEKSQAEIYRLRAKLESTQTENENYQDELEKLQSVVNKSYSDKDRFVSDLDKLREELERSQVRHAARSTEDYSKLCTQTSSLPFPISHMASEKCGQGVLNI